MAVDDSELLRKYAEERSEEAFAELVRRHLGLVHGVALKKVGGDAHLALDVSQVVFVSLARRARALKHHPVLVGWLYTTARNAATDALRSEIRRRRRELEASTLPDTEISSDSPADLKMLRPALFDAIDELNRSDREAILLRFFDGRAFADIGGTLRLTEDGARKRVERALDKLRAVMARRGVTSTAAALSGALAAQAAVGAPAGTASLITASALAGGAAGSIGATVATSILTYMSTKSAVGVAALIACALGIAVWRQERSNIDFRREAADAKDEYVQLQAKLATVVRPQAQSRETVNQAPAGQRLPAQETFYLYLLRNPEFAAVKSRITRREVLAKFGNAIASLNLPPESAAKLKYLLTERDLTGTDAVTLARNAGFADNTAPFHEAVQQATDGVNRQIIALIGDADYAKLQDIATAADKHPRVQAQAADWSGQLADQGMPLTQDQTLALQQLLIDMSGPAKNPDFNSPAAGAADPQTYLSPNQQKVLGGATSFLTPAQVAAIKESEASDNHIMAIGSAAMQKFGDFRIVP